MRVYLRGWIAGLVILMEAPAISGAEARAKPPLPDSWSLVWADEFDAAGRPDPEKWAAETGFLRNGESQYYTGDRWENVRQEGGFLVLECRKESFPTKEGGAATFTSGSLSSERCGGWKYGRFEIRAKMPKGQGVWASLWMMGSVHGAGVPWPECGEIDIAEFVGKEPENIYGTIHYHGEGDPQKQASLLSGIRPTDGFHLYAIDWNQEEIVFYVDEKQYGKFKTMDIQPLGNNPFQKSFYLMVSLAFGGSWGGPMDEAVLPQQLPDLSALTCRRANCGMEY